MRARRPDEAAPLKAFVRHHQTGAVKQQHLDPVATLRTEHHDHAGMDVDAELMAGHHRKTIVTLPEINRTVHRKTNHNPMGPDHHLSGHAASPITTGSTIRKKSLAHTAAPRRETLR